MKRHRHGRGSTSARRVGGNLAKPIRTKVLRQAQRMEALPRVLREREEQRLSVIGARLHAASPALAPAPGHEGDDRSTDGSDATTRSSAGGPGGGPERGPSGFAAPPGGSFAAGLVSLDPASLPRRASAAAAAAAAGGYHGGHGSNGRSSWDGGLPVAGHLPLAPVAVLDTPYYTRQQAVPRQSCALC